jgi:hypothetical protein
VCGECAPRNIEDDGRKKALELDKLVRTKTDVGKKNDGDLGVNPFFLLLKLQLQRQRCCKIERFFKKSRKIFLF